MLDHCSDTPIGAKVDENGCPLDSDGDGIYDGLDKCLNTPPGVKVDANGCPIK
jgi:OOP family OmpA-OmpF porin